MEKLLSKLSDAGFPCEDNEKKKIGRGVMANRKAFTAMMIKALTQ